MSLTLENKINGILENIKKFNQSTSELKNDEYTINIKSIEDSRELANKKLIELKNKIDFLKGVVVPEMPTNDNLNKILNDVIQKYKNLYKNIIDIKDTGL